MKKIYFCLLVTLISLSYFPICEGQVREDEYLKKVKEELRKEWPQNKTVNLVFHGHSVPSGYFRTPQVNTLQAYPHQTLSALKEVYTSSVLNVITTSIGGENSKQGAERFKSEVLIMRPDVLFIDYALNDRGIGLEEARKAWTKMIASALAYGCKVILLTPTPDTLEDILDDQSPLAKHSAQIRELSQLYDVGLVDSYADFCRLKRDGEPLSDYMSQNNHPNEKGHQVVSNSILKWFID